MNKPGFLLIELLTATALFLGSLAALAFVYKQTNYTINTAQAKNQALYSLQSQMEELRAAPFAALLAKNGQSFAQNKGKLVVSQVSGTLVLIQGQLNWKTNQPALVFQSLRSCYE